MNASLATQLFLVPLTDPRGGKGRKKEGKEEKEKRRKRKKEKEERKIPLKLVGEHLESVYIH